jgi:small-conductance mechanosensitive channel/CRP-like cAMP-binding protein
MGDVFLPLLDFSVPFRGLLAVCTLALIALIVLQVLLVAPPWNRRIVGPVVLLVLSLILAVVYTLAATDPAFRKLDSEVALLLLWLGIARCAFVLVFHGLLHFLHRDVPRIFLDIIQSGLYLAVFLIVLVVAGADPVSIVTGSAVISVVLGLSLKDTLGNLFAGLAIQAQRPFDVGDWIQFDENPAHVGEVTEINWRATKLLTLDKVEVIIPNGTLGVGYIANWTKPKEFARRSVYVHAPYDVPPRRVHQIVLTAIAEAWGVLDEPAPSVVTHAFDERGVQYWVRFFTTQLSQRDRVDGGVRDCIWYALNRAGITIPGPLMTVTMRQPSADGAPTKPEDVIARRMEALRRLDLFGVLSSENLQKLAELGQTRLYAPQEVILRQGDAGAELFAIMKGHVCVYAENPDGAKVTLAEIGPGDFFGEGSLITGEERTATVQAADECELLAIGAPAFRQVLRASPDLAGRIRETANRRRAHRNVKLTDSELAAEQEPAPTGGLFRMLQNLLGEK